MQAAATQHRKQFFPINDRFRQYLTEYHRALELPVTYEDMLKYEDSSRSSTKTATTPCGRH